MGGQRAGESARGGGFARAHFSREQSHTAMLHQKLQPRFDLLPSLRGEELFAVGIIGKRGFLKAEKGFPHVSAALPFH